MELPAGLEDKIAALQRAISDFRGDASGLRDHGLDARPGVLHRKALVETAVIFFSLVWAGGRVASAVGLTRICELFFEQIYNEVLRDRVGRLISSLRGQGREVHLVAQANPTTITFNPRSQDDLDHAVAQLRRISTILKVEAADLPFGVRQANLMGYNDGIWAIGSVDHGWFQFEAADGSFGPYQWPEGEPEDDQQFLFRVFSVDIAEDEEQE